MRIVMIVVMAEEIDIGASKLAASKTSNPKVQEFAERMLWAEVGGRHGAAREKYGCVYIGLRSNIRKISTGYGIFRKEFF